MMPKMQDFCWAANDAAEPICSNCSAYRNDDWLRDISLDVLYDKIHPTTQISGNKWYKLKLSPAAGERSGSKRFHCNF